MWATQIWILYFHVSRGQAHHSHSCFSAVCFCCCRFLSYCQSRTQPQLISTHTHRVITTFLKGRRTTRLCSCPSIFHSLTSWYFMLRPPLTLLWENFRLWPLEERYLVFVIVFFHIFPLHYLQIKRSGLISKRSS